MLRSNEGCMIIVRSVDYVADFAGGTNYVGSTATAVLTSGLL